LIRRLHLEGDAARRGAVHGAAFSVGIRKYTDERVRLAASGAWAGNAVTRDDVLELAAQMLPAHRAYAPDLTAELEAMAAAAGITPAEAIIVGGFTDFVDAVRARGGSPPEEDDCTAVIVPDGVADGAGFLAQTWDMHDSATPHVVLLDVRAPGEPAALLFSTVGCIGQIGMNDLGIAIGINNLTATDGRIGVTWPFVVRKALQQRTIADALACVLDADLAGGHDYLLLDAKGDGYNIEAMPTHKAVTRLGERPFVHTNHVLDAEGVRREAARDPALVASSIARLDTARTQLRDRHVTLELLEALTRDPTICRRSEAPFHMETSGAAIMRPRTGELWAVWGLPSDNAYERFEVGVG
jgi:isopenicillin-N N-acyltransferase-like protein